MSDKQVIVQGKQCTVSLTHSSVAAEKKLIFWNVNCIIKIVTFVQRLKTYIGNTIINYKNKNIYIFIIRIKHNHWQ